MKRSGTAGGAACPANSQAVSELMIWGPMAETEEPLGGRQSQIVTGENNTISNQPDATVETSRVSVRQWKRQKT